MEICPDTYYPNTSTGICEKCHNDCLFCDEATNIIQYLETHHYVNYDEDS
jgi:hypothetical protein